MNAILLVVGALTAGFAVLYWMAERGYRRRAPQVLARRPNPTRDEFIAAMPEVDEDIAAFLWDELQPFGRPLLVPHPDDNITEDLAIDPDEPGDWFLDFCRREGLNWRRFPAWPREQAPTIRAIALWLRDGRRTLKGEG